jgi:hypothetical protein
LYSTDKSKSTKSFKTETSVIVDSKKKEGSPKKLAKPIKVKNPKIFNQLIEGKNSPKLKK